jgi:hypothetical protein
MARSARSKMFDPEGEGQVRVTKSLLSGVFFGAGHLYIAARAWREKV